MTRVARHYQHWEFYEEKRDAMDLWNQYLDGVIDGNPRHAALVERVNFRLLRWSDDEREENGLADNDDAD